MTQKRVVVVMCKNQNEVNHAVNHWVNIQKYKRVHTEIAKTRAAHMIKDTAGNYGPCASANQQDKIAVIFSGPRDS